MVLGAVSHTFLNEVETATGLAIQVESDDRLQSPLLARVQFAPGGVPLHRVSYHPNVIEMADYLIAFQCSFVLRLYALPVEERDDLTDTPVARSESMAWAQTHPASASLPHDRQLAFAEFLRTSLMSMLRSIPVGLWIDRDLCERFPALRHFQEQAIRRQIDTHAALLRPEIQRNIPKVPLGLNLAINAAFAKAWGNAPGATGWTLPYLAVGALPGGESLLRRSEPLARSPANDRQVIQAWADELASPGTETGFPFRAEFAEALRRTISGAE